MYVVKINTLKENAQSLAYFCRFQILPKVNDRPMGGNSQNLVTLDT
jgi:hypothetical protein